MAVRPNELRFFGHATVLIDLDGTRVLTDPILVARLGPLWRRPGATREDLEAITPDCVVISHAHHDHLHFPSLRRLIGRPPLVVPTGLGRTVSRAGHEVTELRPGEHVMIGALRIEATPADHGTRQWPGRPASAIGFRMIGTTRVYFAGDTDLFPEMRDLAGGVDVALLPVWGWGPTIGPGHLDPARAAEAVVRIRPRVAIPIHWGTFYPFLLHRFNPKPLERPPIEFADAVGRVAPETEVRVLAPGTATPL
jgi:L-ascorbate metabolism protein UlaG (beta-lactamase superfamily)